MKKVIFQTVAVVTALSMTGCGMLTSRNFTTTPS